MGMAETEKKWTDELRARLVDRRIVDVRYMSNEGADDNGWLRRPVMLVLDNGTVIYPMMDDEGNDGGVLAGMTKEGEDVGGPVLPVVR